MSILRYVRLYYIVTLLKSTHVFHAQTLCERRSDYPYFTDVETEVHLLYSVMNKW